MKRLVIHAGFHKAGTTAIQMALHQQRELLHQVGFVYPTGYGEWAQHALGRPRLKFPIEKVIARIAKLSRKHDRLLLSSEFFSQYSEETIKRLLSGLGPEVRVEVIFTMRRLEKVVSSQYQQLARIGIDLSFDEYSIAVMDKQSTAHETKVFWQRHDYDNIVRRWASTVQPNNVYVVFGDEKSPDLFSDWFEKFLGLPTGSLREVKASRLNRSLDFEELALVLEIQKLLPEERRSKEWVPIFRDSLIRAIVSTPSSNPNSQKLQLTPDLHKAFADLADMQHDSILSLGVQTHGIWHKPSPVSDSPGLATSIHIETVAKAIVAIKPESYIRLSSSKALVRELLSRIKKWALSPFTTK